MPNTKTQGTIFYAESARAATINITGITQAAAAVVTAANTYANGSVVFITGIVGMTPLNDRAFYISGVSGASFTLNGENTTADPAWVSGGTAALCTMQNIGQVADATLFDGKSTEVDITHLLSAAKQFQSGLEDFGNVSLSLILDNVTPDAGQALLRTIRNAQAIKSFQISTIDGKNCAFTASVMSFPVDVKKDGILTSQVMLRVSNEPQYFA
jgi:hypothetical protein